MNEWNSPIIFYLYINAIICVNAHLSATSDFINDCMTCDCRWFAVIKIFLYCFGFPSLEFSMKEIHAISS